MLSSSRLFGKSASVTTRVAFAPQPNKNTSVLLALLPLVILKRRRKIASCILFSRSSVFVMRMVSDDSSALTFRLLVLDGDRHVDILQRHIRVPTRGGSSPLAGTAYFDSKNSFPSMTVSRAYHHNGCRLGKIYEKWLWEPGGAPRRVGRSNPRENRIHIIKKICRTLIFFVKCESIVRKAKGAAHQLGDRSHPHLQTVRRRAKSRRRCLRWRGCRCQRAKTRHC